MKERSHVHEFLGRRVLVILTLLLVLVVLVPLATSLGLRNATFLDVYKLLLGSEVNADSIALWLRLRRALVGVIVGGLLGGAGVVAQATYRNPLASPFTLGISQAAALGVAVTLITGYAGKSYHWFHVVLRPYLLPVSAFAFAMLQSMLVLFLAYSAGLSPYALILSSIALSFLYQSILALVQYLVLNELQVATIVFWMFGDLGRPGNAELMILAACFVPIVVTYMLMHLDLDLIALGDDLALASGTDPKRFRLISALVASLGASLATSFVGVLAFICLLAPHIARGLVGGSHKYLLPASTLVGSILLVVADTLSRTVMSPLTLPVGVTLSFMGAPLLVYILLRGARYGGCRGR